jgi:hypothetical protein
LRTFTFTVFSVVTSLLPCVRVHRRPIPLRRGRRASAEVSAQATPATTSTKTNRGGYGATTTARLGGRKGFFFFFFFLVVFFLLSCAAFTVTFLTISHSSLLL